MAFKACIIILTFMLLDTCKTASLATNQTTEQSLITSLLTGYNKNIRPETQVTVSVTVYLKQIISLDEKNQILTTSFYVEQYWKDPRLFWDPTSYIDIDVVNVPVKSIWIPDTFVLNTADTDGYFKISDYSYAAVRNDGYVSLVLPAILVKTRCALNMKKYPFDTQTCSIMLTSWAQASNRITYSLNDSDLNLGEYIPNSIWDLYDPTIEQSESGNRNLFEEYYNTEIKMEFTLKRKPLFMMINGILPCFILNIVTLISYVLPYAPQIALSMTCFLTYSVNGVRVSSDIPAQSDISTLPLVTVYFFVSMLYTLVSIIWFFFLNQFSTKGNMPEPLVKFGAALEKLFSFDCIRAKKVAPKMENKKTVPENVKKESENKVDVEKMTAIVAEPSKCNNCNKCEKCLNAAEADKERAAKKKQYDSKVDMINYFVLFTFTLMMLASQLAIWLTISS